MQLNLQLGQKVIDTMPKPIAGHCYLYCSPTLDPISNVFLVFPLNIFIFEINFLHDEIIFFIQFFFYDLEYNSTILESRLEHCILQHVKSPGGLEVLVELFYHRR